MTESATGESALEEEEVGLTEEELEIVLDYLMSHKKAFVQGSLRARNLAFSGTKEALRTRLEGYLGDGQLNSLELVTLLNRIEGWGNQHIYLYTSPDRSLSAWTSEQSAREHLGTLGLADLLNRQRSLVLPDEPTLSSIEWSPDRLRFIWIEKRQWEERLTEKDMQKNDIIWRAYHINRSRGLVAFDLDLISGRAMLMIQRLPSGTQYELTRNRFEEELEPMIGLSHFERVRVSEAIHGIEVSDEVRRRQLAYQTRRGGKAAFTSANQSWDTYADPDLERAGQALGGETAGLLGNFYWLPVRDQLEREIHVKLYSSDQRVGIFGEHREKDVRYVLSRINYYCN